MSYEVYKMMHFVSIVIFFALFAVAAYSGESTKKNKIVTGVALFFILLGGMGLKKFAAPGAWPLWLNLKMTIWLIVGSVGHMAIKRIPQHAIKVFWGSVGLLTLASYLANYKL